MKQSDLGIGSPPQASHTPRLWYSPHRAIVTLGALLIAVSVAGGMLGVVNSSKAENAIALMNEHYLVLQAPVRQLQSADADFQMIAAPVLAGSVANSTLIASAVADSNASNKAYLTVSHLLSLPGNGTLAPHLAAQMAAYDAARSRLGAYLAGEKVSAHTAHIGAVEQATNAKLDAALTALQATITNQVAHAASEARAASDAARVDLLWCLVVGGTFAILVTAIFARKALYVERELARKDALQLTLTDRNEFESRLQRALEMAKHEEPVFDLVTEALHEAAPDLPAELLLADSSRAHFRQVLVSAAAGHGLGCGVVSPNDCPAASRGQTLSFPSSTALDACPHLRGRGCSALCVPVSISGNSVGVFHVRSTDGVAPSDAVRRDIEVVARRASERLAMLRAFELSNTQANTDSLTGLLTRRSLESSVRELKDGDAIYAVAYGDLDHFKQLNDVFGHDAGDRALRSFSQVLRDSLRPADIPCRYGGEEFVIVLPRCGVPEAVLVLERVMRRTADRLAAGNHPNFTVSFGVASSDQAPDFHSVVTLADEALLQAKSGGRNQIVVADSLGSIDPTEFRRVVKPESGEPLSTSLIDDLAGDISALSPSSSPSHKSVIVANAVAGDNGNNNVTLETGR
jgi:diguanylate cyclase (GGDEF)-like protein